MSAPNERRGWVVNILDPMGLVSGWWDIMSGTDLRLTYKWAKMVRGALHVAWVRRLAHNLYWHMEEVKARGQREPLPPPPPPLPSIPPKLSTGSADVPPNISPPISNIKCCTICDRAFNTVEQYERHLRTKKHREAAQIYTRALQMSRTRNPSQELDIYESLGYAEQVNDAHEEHLRDCGVGSDWSGLTPSSR